MHAEALFFNVHVCIMHTDTHTCVKGLCEWEVEHSGPCVEQRECH